MYRNCAAYFLTLVLTGIMFMLLPATIRRPEVPGKDFFSWLTRFIYACDQPNNLCPSLHVVCSYYCWRAIWDTEGIPLWYRRFNFVFAAGVLLDPVREATRGGGHPHRRAGVGSAAAAGQAVSLGAGGIRR